MTPTQSTFPPDRVAAAAFDTATEATQAAAGAFASAAPRAAGVTDDATTLIAHAASGVATALGRFAGALVGVMTAPLAMAAAAHPLRLDGDIEGDGNATSNADADAEDPARPDGDADQTAGEGVALHGMAEDAPAPDADTVSTDTSAAADLVTSG